MSSVETTVSDFVRNAEPVPKSWTELVGVLKSIRKHYENEIAEKAYLLSSVPEIFDDTDKVISLLAKLKEDYAIYNYTNLAFLGARAAVIDQRDYYSSYFGELVDAVNAGHQIIDIVTYAARAAHEVFGGRKSITFDRQIKPVDRMLDIRQFILDIHQFVTSIDDEIDELDFEKPYSPKAETILKVTLEEVPGIPANALQVIRTTLGLQ